MATFYPNSSNQRNLLPALCPRILGHEPYTDSSIHPSIFHQYYGSSDAYSDPTAENSRSRLNLAELPITTSMLHASSACGSHVEDNFISTWGEKKSDMIQFDNDPLASNAQGLSLSLGREHPLHSVQFHETSFSGSNLSLLRSSSCSRERSISNEPSMHYPIPSSKYLKAAQELLEEVVHVQSVLEQKEEKNQSNPPTKEKNPNMMNNRIDPSIDGFDPDNSSEISEAERQAKMSKLLNMLDEVDRLYKQYCHQIQMVVLTFDQVAGLGVGKRYTALARQTISRHFRSLRDAIDGQIRVLSMGQGDFEQPSHGDQANGGIQRLRYIDQKIRQERSFQQFGINSQLAWRPQRGLPETSVSILRAWLFEHFLHPYPKDSDKLLLARQTGLTRNQVSNWFINARVRLWKPMVEEMYKEEFGSRHVGDGDPCNGGNKPSHVDHPAESTVEHRQDFIRSGQENGD
ncbi:BEL1-like homeodomain 7 isoform X2 [Wolffia australiana]